MNTILGVPVSKSGEGRSGGDTIDTTKKSCICTAAFTTRTARLIKKIEDFVSIHTNSKSDFLSRSQKYTFFFFTKDAVLKKIFSIRGQMYNKSFRAKSLKLA